MELGGDRRPARQQEVAVVCKPDGHGVHLLLQAQGQLGRPQRIGIGHSGRRGHMAHHRHQLALDGVQQFLPRIIRRQHGADDAYQGVQFVQATIGLDANVVFGHTGTAVNAGGALVARSGIDSFHALRL